MPTRIAATSAAPLYAVARSRRLAGAASNTSWLVAAIPRR